MGLIAGILRSARERDQRFAKARAAVAKLTLDEKGILLAEIVRELRAGPPVARRPRKPRPRAILAPRARAKTLRERVAEVLAAPAPLNVAGVHAAIERTAPGVANRNTVAAAVSEMLARGLLVKRGGDGRSMSVALAGFAGPGLLAGYCPRTNGANGNGGSH